MAVETALDTTGGPVKTPAPGGGEKKKQMMRWSVVTRLWKGLFGDEDLQKKLESLSKEEASIQARMKSRARWSQKIARNVIYLSVISEVVAASFAAATRSKDSDWKRNALRVSPMFALFFLSAGIYKGFAVLMRMLDSKDQKTLEWLRAERKAKVDKLKEQTNFYDTQQLIERYDLDPAAKAAAASVLAYKLGADAGYDVELVQSTGIRNRKSNNAPNSATSQSYNNAFDEYVVNSQEVDAPDQQVVKQFRGSIFGDGGWLARIAALLVGEDPTHCYALICAHCRMHNGLIKKEDFPYITYYCPHCRGLNGSRHQNESPAPPSGVDESLLTNLGLAVAGEVLRGSSNNEIDRFNFSSPTSPLEISGGATGTGFDIYATS